MLPSHPIRVLLSYGSSPVALRHFHYKSPSVHSKHVILIAFKIPRPFSSEHLGVLLCSEVRLLEKGVFLVVAIYGLLPTSGDPMPDLIFRK